MFGPTSDEYCLLHRGTRVRKMHSSYRSTFRTIGDVPLAMIDPDGIEYLKHDFKRRRSDREVKINTAFEEKVTILYYYPNMSPDIVDAVVEKGYRGIVIAGTGLGHINKPLYPAIKRATDAGVHIFMTVQTIWGYVQMYVYETGREIMELGVSPASNMLPEVAYMKLCWTLGQTDDRDEVRRIMLTPVVDETTKREPYNGYLVFQGAIPEVQDFLKSSFR
jgi:glutamyl-tRNA(Gln) amidotransferase subunit D